MESIRTLPARSHTARVPWPIPVAIAAAWLVAMVAEATGKGRLLSHDALVHSGLPIWAALGIHLLAWQFMVAAMMLPTALPMIRLFAATSRGQERPGETMSAFLGSYALVWTAFGAMAFLGDVGIHRLVHETPWLFAHPWVIAGGTLALAGAAYQGVFRNPLADPYLLGAAAGAGLGATLTVAYASATALSGDLLPVAAFCGAAIAVLAAYVLGRSAGVGAGPAALVLAGVTITAFFTAMQTFVQQQHVQTVQEIYSWLLGRLATAGWREVGIVVPYAAAAWIVILAHRRLLDVLAVGDEEAAALGVNVARVRLLVVVAATVGTAAAVAVSGLIGFVGIIVPHTIRLLVGGSYRLLLPLSVLVGAGFLVLADVAARTVMSPAELPIGVVTAFFGAPFFAVVLRTSRKVA
jgi:iron complex transport system permease protein